MWFNKNQYRAMYATLLLVAFFIPAYNGVSAFQFLFHAVSSKGNDSEITLVDLLVISLPLLLILSTAVLILLRAVTKRPPNSLLLGLPFLSLSFFFVIFSFDINRQVGSNNAFGLLTQMSVGFYLAAFASLLLLLSYSRRESLNLGPGRR